jgi:NADH:ubiquinone oxidoreductase subunit 6 (subunit J)
MIPDLLLGSIVIGTIVTLLLALICFITFIVLATTKDETKVESRKNIYNYTGFMSLGSLVNTVITSLIIYREVNKTKK